MQGNVLWIVHCGIWGHVFKHVHNALPYHLKFIVSFRVLQFLLRTYGTLVNYR